MSSSSSTSTSSLSSSSSSLVIVFCRDLSSSSVACFLSVSCSPS